MNVDQILPVTDVKKRLLELLKSVQNGGGNIVITKNGKAAGVLLSMDEYEGLLETLDIMSNPGTMKALEEARKNFAEGRFITHEEMWKEDE